jgi:hypothetical protein
MRTLNEYIRSESPKSTGRGDGFDFGIGLGTGIGFGIPFGLNDGSGKGFGGQDLWGLEIDEEEML